MHETLAFDFGRWMRIWHKDPGRYGNEDSCGWGFPHLTVDEIEYATALITDDYDNIRSFFPGVRMLDAEGYVMQIFRLYKAHTRRWWQHPRWHFWHWRLQSPIIRDVKRWVFSRCSRCDVSCEEASHKATR